MKTKEKEGKGVDEKDQGYISERWKEAGGKEG